MADLYDRNYRHAVPFYDELHQILATTIGHVLSRQALVLDLGCGTGEIGRRSLTLVPEASWVLVDGSEAMLRRARAILMGRVRDALVGDFTGRDIWSQLKNLDAVVSSFAFHAIDDNEKRLVMENVANALKPGGIFLIGDLVKVKGNTEAMIYKSLVKENMDRSLKEGLLEPAFFEKEFHRKEGDSWEEMPAGLEEQLEWISRAGLEPVLIWKYLGVALFGGVARESTAQRSN